MKPPPIASMITLAVPFFFSLIVAVAPARAAAPPPPMPGVPTTTQWDKKCTELTLIGPADGSTLGANKAELMTGSCPGGTVIAKGSCWA